MAIAALPRVAGSWILDPMDALEFACSDFAQRDDGAALLDEDAQAEVGDLPSGRYAILRGTLCGSP